MSNLFAIQACPSCHSTASSLWQTIDGWHIRRCDGCQLARLDPRPDADSLATYYNESYFDSRISDEVEERANRRTQRMMRRRIDLFSRWKPSGRLLDAGCAEGDFLAAARDAGYQVSGFDASPVAVERAARRHGISVGTGMIGSAEVEGTFDVISAWHVLEHTDDPVEALKWLDARLAPGGILVLEVPNAGSLDAHKLGEKWHGWQPPVHLWHFTRESLLDILDKAGYEPVATRLEASTFVRRRVGAIPILKVVKSVAAHCASGTSMAFVFRRKPL